jgi:hypothetical protein
MNLLTFVLNTYETSKPVPGGNREKGYSVRYWSNSAKSTMYRTVRPSSEEVFPLFAGWWIHRHNIPNVYLIYCASMLMLLQPWFGLEEVMEGYDSFVDAFDEFKENARVDMLATMDNLQAYHKCANLT